MSSEAKNLLRGGLAEDQLVKEVNEKGYFSGSKQIDQECDGILHIHLFKHNRETFFTVQRDKHRIPTVIPDEDKYYIMKFPKYAPIPDDLDREDQSFRRMGSAPSNTSEDLFKLG
jgi:hypothetical protein